MLPLTADALRTFLHVLAATVWVGGQLTLAGLVPTLKGLGPDAPRAVARQFNRIAWPAFGVLVVTGNPQARQNGTRLKGTRVTFFSGQEFLEVENATTIIEGGKKK